MIDYRFTLSQAAEFTGVSVTTIRSWYTRGQLRVGLEGVANEDEPPLAAGYTRLVTKNTVIAIGVMAELIKLGVDLERAANAAVRFAHTGGQAIDSQTPRQVGELWDDGAWTIITVQSDKAVSPEILRVGHNDKFRDLLARATHQAQGSKGFALLVVDDVVKQILEKIEERLN